MPSPRWVVISWRDGAARVTAVGPAIGSRAAYASSVVLQHVASDIARSSCRGRLGSGAERSTAPPQAGPRPLPWALGINRPQTLVAVPSDGSGDHLARRQKPCLLGEDPARIWSWARLE